MEPHEPTLPDDRDHVDRDHVDGPQPSVPLETSEMAVSPGRQPPPYAGLQPTRIESEIVAAESAEMNPRRPRWWTAFAVAAVSLAVFVATSSIMLFAAMFLVHGELTLELLRDEGSLQAISRSRIGLLALVVIPQLALVLPSVCAALLSPVPTRRRLGLVRGQWPIWAWIAAAAATPLVGLVSGLVTGFFLEESESLKQMSGIFREHGQTGFLIPLALMIGATPALCEELLFRGYVQTRLVASLGPAAGVIIASLLFAAFHMDLVHIIAVFPLGLFLGWLAWRSGSIFPAMCGHFVNNVISVFAVVIAPEGQTDVLSLPTVAISLAVIGAGILGMTAVAIAAILYGRPASVVQTA
jgi:membrane protease YdiL (CAAX protease family)